MAVMNYRTEDGTADYGFSIEYEPTIGWRVYVVFQPNADDPEVPYQAIDQGGRRYINWSLKLDSLGDARTVAAFWAELAHRHVRTNLNIKARGRSEGGGVVLDVGGAGSQAQGERLNDREGLDEGWQDPFSGTVSIWTSGDDGSEVANALKELLAEYGVALEDDGRPVSGSWKQRFKLVWQAFTSMDAVQNHDWQSEVARRLEIELVEATASS